MRYLYTFSQTNAQNADLHKNRSECTRGMVNSKNVSIANSELL